MSSKNDRCRFLILFFATAAARQSPGGAEHSVGHALSKRERSAVQRNINIDQIGFAGEK